MITREADYAIRLMLYLATNANGSNRPIATDVLADEMHIPYRFLRRIVLRMVKAGLVITTRGRGGGMWPGRPVADISLMDVIEAVNPRSLTLNECLNGQSNCPRKKDCVIREEVARVQTNLRDNLNAIRFGNLATRRPTRRSRSRLRRS